MILRNEFGQFLEGSHYREPKPYWNREFLYDLYVTKEMSCGDIAEKYNVTEAAILYWLRKHKIKRRTVSEAREVKYWGANGEYNPMFGKNGDSNPNYKGGITPKRQYEYSHLEWKSIAKSVKKRANGFCERCGIQHKRLHIHHIIPIKDGGDIVCSPSLLIVLCPKCHGFIHSKRNTSRELLK